MSTGPEIEAAAGGASGTALYDSQGEEVETGSVCTVADS